MQANGPRSSGLLRLAAVCVLAVALTRFSQAADDPGKKGNAQLYERAKAASVEVLVNGHLNGSGCFVDRKGIVVTAAHVIEEPGRRIEINSAQAGRLGAKMLAVDLGHDLALLKVDSAKDDFAA